MIESRFALFPESKPGYCNSQTLILISYVINTKPMCMPGDEVHRASSTKRFTAEKNGCTAAGSNRITLHGFLIFTEYTSNLILVGDQS